MADDVRGIAYPLYARVERERVLRGWSATQLHKQTGVSRSTIANWAFQSQPPQASTVNAVADVLGIERVEALRLAGILTDPAEDDLPDLSGLTEQEQCDLIGAAKVVAALLAKAQREQERRGA